MAGKQGSSPIATGKPKGDLRTSQTQLNSFFIDRSPEARVKKDPAQQKLDILAGPKQTAIISIEKERFSLAKFNEWLDRCLKLVDPLEWNLGTKTRLLVTELLDKYAQQSVFADKPTEQVNIHEQQPKQARKYTTRASRARRSDEKENIPVKSENTTVEDEKTHRDWVKRCLFKNLAKFVVLSSQYSWENKYKPSIADEVGVR